MFEVFIGVVAVLASIGSFRLANRQAKSKVISSLKFALRLTRKHIEENRVGEFGEIGFSDKESIELSKAWANVAEAIRPYDSSLAQTFEDKSDYWLRPTEFHSEIQDGDRRFNYRFRIDEVEKELFQIEKFGL